MVQIGQNSSNPLSYIDHLNINTLPYENYRTNVQLKFAPQYCYYIGGSIKPSKDINLGHWKENKLIM